MAQINNRSVGSTSIEYDSMSRLWRRSRAILEGELAAKDHDTNLDLVNYTNLLIPFSSQMSPEQYRWYVSEAELPGLTSQFSRVLLGGLLRKAPNIVLPESAPEDAEDWLRNNFSRENGSLVSFLDQVISEELVTYATAISVDYPEVDNYRDLSPEERAQLSPFPVFWKAEDIINRQVGTDPQSGKEVLTRVVFRYWERNYDENDYHPMYVETVADYHLEDGYCVVDYWSREPTDSVAAKSGEINSNIVNGFVLGGANQDWKPSGKVIPKMNGEPLKQLPVFFTNGSASYQHPLLTPLIDREIALYNKVSRRNHLLLGAATYTPVIKSDMSDEDFQAIVRKGLGSWIKLGSDDDVDVLKTPTEPLKDMDRAIEQGVAEMSRLGIRILAPEGSSGDSGVALEIRNSSQTAQLAVLNTRISNTLTQVIRLMLEWKYGEGDWDEVEFTLSADFNPAPLGKEWMRLVTEWYESRIIPRSSFIKMAKQHDLLPPDYDDEEAIQEISQDTLVGPQETIEIEE